MRTRRAYLVTTGAVFGLIVAAHVMRLALEGPQLAMDPRGSSCSRLPPGL
jgi:hypothetical protein